MLVSLRVILAGAWLTLISLLTPRAAWAETPEVATSAEAAASLLASGDLEQTKVGIGALVQSGHPRALAVLRALDAGGVVVTTDGVLLLKTDKGFEGALSGVPVTPNGPVEKPRLNNLVRRELSSSLAQLRLRAPDLAIRREAVEEMAHRPIPELRDLMRSALEQETESELRESLSLALAQLDVSDPDRATKLNSIKVLERAGNVSHRPLLEPLIARDKAGAFLVDDAELRKAARGALGSIGRRATLMSGVANLFFGLSLGSVLLLAALGLAITFGLMKVINMAHGEILMLGAYATFAVQQLFAEYLPSMIDWYLVAAVPAAFLVSGLAGLLLERLVVRHLYGRPLETLLATWGVSLILTQIVRARFGASNVTVANPTWLSGGWELLPSVVLPYSRIAIIAFTAVVVYFVWFLLRRTNLGLYVRAVTQNRDMAANVGVPTQRIDTWTFALGCGVAGLGGVAISQLGNVGPELGQGYIVDSFMVVVLGGVGNIFGTVFGAVGLGLVNKFLEPIAGAVLGKIFVLVLIILFIQKRPQGIFALKGRAAEL